MRIDNYDFEKTAQAVFIMNNSVRSKFEDWQNLKEFMINMAYTYCHDSNSFSTYGFCLTAYPSPDGEDRCVRASVSAGLAMSFLEKEV